jgi:phage baseplate assembly protein W
MPTPIQALSFPFAVDVGLGRLRQEPDPERYIAQLIRQVILTAPGERIHRPDFGAGLHRQVLALNSIAGAVLVETSVYQALDRWLGALIKIDRVQATAQGEFLLIGITYIVRQQGDRRFLNVQVAL